MRAQLIEAIDKLLQFVNDHHRPFPYLLTQDEVPELERLDAEVYALCTACVLTVPRIAYLYPSNLESFGNTRIPFYPSTVGMRLYPDPNWKQALLGLRAAATFVPEDRTLPHIDPGFVERVRRAETLATELGNALHRTLEKGDGTTPPQWEMLLNCVAGISRDKVASLPAEVQDYLRILVNHVKDARDAFNSGRLGFTLAEMYLKFLTAGENLCFARKRALDSASDPLDWADKDLTDPEGTTPRATATVQTGKAGANPDQVTTGGADGARIGAGSPKATKKRLEDSGKESDKLKFQVYKHIQAQRADGKKPAEILADLKADKDRRKQVKEAGLKLDRAMVRAALVFFSQREREEKRK
jgi:hypothetical protein